MNSLDLSSTSLQLIVQPFVSAGLYFVAAITVILIGWPSGPPSCPYLLTSWQDWFQPSFAVERPLISQRLPWSPGVGHSFTALTPSSSEGWIVVPCSAVCCSFISTLVLTPYLEPSPFTWFPLEKEKCTTDIHLFKIIFLEDKCYPRHHFRLWGKWIRLTGSQFAVVRLPLNAISYLCWEGFLGGTSSKEPTLT